jgi:hypothetical protein
MSPEQTRLSDDELFQLVGYFGLSERDRDPELTAFLERELQSRRPSEWDRKNQTAWCAYILRLILACPRFLNSLPGFEWVFRDFCQLLALRQVDEGRDGVFWAALDQVRRQLRPGRPPRKGRDYLIALMVHGRMNATGLSKSKIIAEMAEELVRMAPPRPHTDAVTTKTREIKEWLQRVKDEGLQFAALRAKAGLGPANRVPGIEEPTSPASTSQSVPRGIAWNPPAKEDRGRRTGRTSVPRRGPTSSRRKRSRTPRKARD